MLPPEEPGAGEVLCTGMTGCSPNQRESNPSASAFCATTAASIGCRPENTEIPMFMIASFLVPLEQYGTCAACQLHQVFKHRTRHRLIELVLGETVPEREQYRRAAPANQ